MLLSLSRGIHILLTSRSQNYNSGLAFRQYKVKSVVDYLDGLSDLRLSAFRVQNDAKLEWSNSLNCLLLLALAIPDNPIHIAYRP